MPQSDQNKSECRFRVQLESKLWMDQEYFRCQIGRFDDKFGTRSFVWRGIWHPNKTVKTAQKDCPCFKVYPQVKPVSRKGRP